MPPSTAKSDIAIRRAWFASSRPSSSWDKTGLDDRLTDAKLAVHQARGEIELALRDLSRVEETLSEAVALGVARGEHDEAAVEVDGPHLGSRGHLEAAGELAKGDGLEDLGKCDAGERADVRHRRGGACGSDGSTHGASRSSKKRIEDSRFVPRVNSCNPWQTLGRVSRVVGKVP